jgi:hypothetical protein
VFDLGGENVSLKFKTRFFKTNFVSTYVLQSFVQHDDQGNAVGVGPKTFIIYSCLVEFFHFDIQSIEKEMYRKHDMLLRI